MKFLEKKIFLTENKISVLNKKHEVKFLLSEMKKIGIEELPYAYTSLKKFIDSKTMNVHYNKHYKGYVKKLNNAISKIKSKDMDLEEIVKSISKFDKKVRNNAGGAFNHALFWKMLTPKKTNISKEFLRVLKTNFGSLKNFETEFSEIAKDVFGSGWVWLVVSKTGKLKIVSTPNQDNPLMNVVQKGGYPILGLDVWEHAYYLKYQNKRDEYIKNFWNVVNWEFVEKLYNTKTKKSELIKESSQDKISTQCATEEKNQIKKIFNNNPQVVEIYKKSINFILKQMFSEYWKEKGQYQSNELGGVYNFEKEGRSVLNKLNTNFTAFCLLFRDVNKVLKMENKPQLTLLFDKTKEDQIESTKQFVKKIYEYKDRIFSINSPTFKGLMKILESKHQQGENTEMYVITKLANHFGKENVINTAKLGGLQDVYGSDCIIKINSKDYTAQIKPYNKVEKILLDDLEMYKILETGYVKKYTTDFLIFGKLGNKILVFNNKKTKIIDGIYHIPSDDLIAEL